MSMGEQAGEVKGVFQTKIGGEADLLKGCT